jgi:hypothetical protein
MLQGLPDARGKLQDSIKKQATKLQAGTGSLEKESDVELTPPKSLQGRGDGKHLL